MGRDMSQHQIIEAVRNRKTAKLFILVDDSVEMRYKVINPAGEVLILPDLLFEEDPCTVTGDAIAEEFSPEQLEALERYQEKAAAAAAAAAASARAQAERPPVVKRAEPKAAPRTPRSPKRETSASSSKRGLGATWNAPRLTFFRHKIDPLGPKQTFRILVEGAGEFELTKEEFLAHFNDVCMSATYRAEGLFSYPKVPEKALRYLRKPG